MSDTEKGSPSTTISPLPIDAESMKYAEALSGAIEATVPSASTTTLGTSATPHEYPEGGLRAYLAVFGAFMALFCTFGQLNSFGTYQAWYHQNQLRHLTPSTISWIGSLQLWVFFFSGGLIGQLFDKYGPTWLLIAGSMIFTSSIVGTSLASHYYQYILAQGVLFGLGVGLLFYPSLASVSTYFSKYRATMLGIASAGSSIGGVVYPIMLQRLFKIVGFGWGVRISGLVSAVCCITAALTVTPLALPKKGTAAEPCATGITAFTDRPYILLGIGSALVALGLFIPLFYIVECAHQLSLAQNQTIYVLAILNAGGVIGRIIPAVLADSLGRFNLIVPAALLAGISCLTLWLNAHSMAVLCTFAAVYGFASGAFIALLTPCVAQISEVTQFGVRIGVLYSVISFPSLVGGPAAGAFLVYDHGLYNDMIIFSGCTLCAGAFFILLARLSINLGLFERL